VAVFVKYGENSIIITAAKKRSLLIREKIAKKNHPYT
jgi:hypothetical protein